MGMPEGVIAEVDRTGRTGGRLTVRAPIGGVVQTLNARAGVTLATGQTLAEISGLGTVWLNAALPEAQAGLSSEEHTSEPPSLMRISYAVLCLKQKKLSTNDSYDTA